MASKQPFVHQRMLPGLAGFYPSLCTIQEAVESNDLGEVTDVWVDVWTAIPCRVSPVGVQEMKRPDQTFTLGSHTINLAGCYPLIIPKMRAKVGLIYFDVLGVESDGNGYTTRLQARIVKATA